MKFFCKFRNSVRNVALLCDCGQIFRLGDAFDGNIIRCPKCQMVEQFPDEEMCEYLEKYALMIDNLKNNNEL